MNQQEQLEALAEQNRLLKEALKDAAPDMLNDARRTLNTYGIADGTIYEAEKKAKLARKHMELLSLPDLSTSILNKRDVKTLGEAVCVCEELLLGRSTFSADEIFGIRCCIKEIERLAAEKEKQ